MAGASIDLNNAAKDQGFSARFVCLTGKSLKGGRHPIRLQLIHNLKVKRYTTGEACTLKQWDAEAGRMKPRAQGATQVNGVLGEMAARVKGIVDALAVHGRLTLDNFHKQYRDPKGGDNIVAFMRSLEADYVKDGRIGYATTLRTAASALSRLNEGRPLRFADLTAERLEDLERVLKAEGCKPGGIAAYMRTIRAAVNKAIKEGKMAERQYPFDTATHKGYSMSRLKSTPERRALSEQDMDKLKRFPFDTAPHLAESVRMFLFSYYADGMNFQDMARLRRSNLKGGRIFYERKKTKRAINIPVDKVLADLLKDLGGHDGPYLLPILGPEHVTDMQQWNRVRKYLKRVNKQLKEAAEVVGIEADLTTYVARHTAFTTYYRKGVPLQHISEMARHSSPAVTQLYLRSLGADVLDEARKKLR